MANKLLFVGTTGLIFFGLSLVLEPSWFGFLVSALVAGISGLIVAAIYDEFIKHFFEPDLAFDEARLRYGDAKGEFNMKAQPGWDRRYAHFNPYLKRILGEEVTPHGASIALVLFGLAPNDRRSTPAKPIPGEQPQDKLYRLNTERLTALRWCWDDFEKVDEAFLQELGEVNKDLAQKIENMIVMRRNEKLSESKAALTAEYLMFATEISERTNMNYSHDEDADVFVSKALANVNVQGLAISGYSRGGLDLNLQRLPKEALEKYLLDRARFEIWLESLDSENWDAIGGKDSPLAEDQYKKIQKEQAEWEREQNHLSLLNSIRKLMEEARASCDHLQREIEPIKEMELSTNRGRWLYGRTRPAPQPYGVSAQGAEFLVADWLAYLGETGVQQTQYVGDGGVDVFTDNLCVQVKNYEKQTVSSSETRDIFGTATSEGLQACIFTSSKLSGDAAEFAEKNSIIAIHYSATNSSLLALSSSGREFLSRGEYRS